MKLLYYLADLFVDVFGITRPSAPARRRAAFFILGLLLLVVAVVVGAGILLHAMMQ